MSNFRKNKINLRVLYYITYDIYRCIIYRMIVVINNHTRSNKLIISTFRIIVY